MKSGKKKIIWLFASLMGSFLVIYFLQIDSFYRLNKQAQNIMRTYISLPKKSCISLKLGRSDYYFAGRSGNHFYLANFQIKDRLIRFDISLKDTATQNVYFPTDAHALAKNFKTMVDSQYVYVFQKEGSIIYKSPITDMSIVKIILTPSPYLFDGLIVPGAFIVKSYDTASRQNIICKYDEGGKFFAKNNQILQKQSDGVISTDGMLFYEPLEKSLYYIYYYRNQIICFDTDLHLKYRASTIDTNSYAKISLRYLKLENYTTFSAPMPFVNRTACVSNSQIYILSTMIARNDPPEVLQENAIIDIYDSRNGRYLKSFYLPNFHGEKLHTIEVFSNKLLALQGDYIVIYNLPVM